MEKELFNYGILGIAVVALGYFILKLLKDHKKERDEWKETMNRQFDKMEKREDETNRVMRDNTGILQGLKTLLENRK